MFALIFAFSRKHYKTEEAYYLDYNPIIEPKVSVIIPTYNEEKNVQKIGTTGRGIGPTYVNKYNRNGIRALDLLNI